MTTTILASFPSPPQGVWHLGFIPIRAYAMFILIGVIVALFIGDRRWAERGGERGVIFDIALWAIIFGLIGGRLYHVLTDWATYFGPGGAGFWAAFKIQEGGLGIWGAVALGGVGAWIGCRRQGIPLPAFGDAIAPGIVLAQAIGRIGNYFNQELYGGPTTLPWGLEIFERRDANGALDSLNGVSTGQLIEVVHPTFLYELLWNLLVFALLIWVDRRYRIGHGRLFALYVAAYCFGRFWIELMRSDMATHIAGIRINSFVSVFVFIGAVVYIMVAPKGREDPSELRGDAGVEVKAAPDVEVSPIDELAKELAGVAATTGVVAAAKVAGDKEDEAAEEPEAEAEEPEVEAVADAPAEDIAEAEAFAEAGEEADAVGGVGADEGDEVVEAEVAVPEVHQAAVESADEAAAVADEVAEEPEEPESATDDSGEETEDSGEAAETEAEQPAEQAADEEQAEPVGGVGVEGDEVEVAAPEVQQAAVGSAGEDAAVADEVAEEVSGEETEDSGEAAETEAEQPAEQAADEEQAEPVRGVGVEGDEVEVAAPEVHQAAVGSAGEDAAVADEVAEEVSGEETEDSGEAAETEAEQPAEEAADEEQAELVGGVGAVEGDEVEVAVPEVHQAAVGSADQDAAVADEVADEPEEPESATDDSGEETEDSGEAAETEAEQPAEEAADEEQAEPVRGVGVEGDEVEVAAPEVHQAAVGSAGEDAAVADEVADEPEEPESATDDSGEETEDSGEAAETEAEQPAEQAADEEQAESVGGVSADEAASVADEVADEPAEEAEKAESSDAAEAESKPAPAPAPGPEQVEESGGRLRAWLRSRRNR